MADKEVGGITAATTPLDGTETLHLVQGGNSRRATTLDLSKIFLPIDTEVGTTYAPVIGDIGLYKQMSNVAPITVTFNTGIFSAGQEIHFEQTGAGLVSFAAGAGFTLNSRGARLDMGGQYGIASVKFKSATEATLFGDLV